MIINLCGNSGGGAPPVLDSLYVEQNGVYIPSEGVDGYSEVTVNVDSGKIDIAATGIKLGNSTFTELPDGLDFSNVTDMNSMFSSCQNITTIAPIDTSNVTNMGNMFAQCSKLQTIPQFDTAKVTNMGGMFSGCSSLQSIPELNTSNVTNIGSMFNSCTSLQSIPLLDCGNVKSTYYFLGFSSINTLTHLGGFKDLKVSIDNCFLDKAPNLTVDSLMNVINNVYDLTANGLSGQLLIFGSTNLNKLTAEQIAVATAKGWTLTA